MLLIAANCGTNITTVENGISRYYKKSLHSSDTRGHFNVPVFDLSRIDTCYHILLGSIDQETQCYRPVSLDSCLEGHVDNPGDLVFDGWEPGFFTLYMVVSDFSCLYRG